MHSCIYVLITGPEEETETLVDQALAPFDEHLTVPPYKLHLVNSGVRTMAEHYKIAETDLQSLAKKMPDWMGCPGGIDELGLFAIRSDNPDGKWDWYKIGGRWHGYIRGRRRPGVIGNNFIRAADLLASRDFAKRLPFGVVTPTGEWVQRSTVVSTANDWYCRESPLPAWRDHVRRILAAFPKHRVVCVDVHS